MPTSPPSHVAPRLIRLAAALAIVLAGCSPDGPTSSVAPASSPAASPVPTTNPLVARLTSEGLHAHLAALDAIARDNGGNRAVGSPGFDASIKYAEQELAAFGYDVIRQDFVAPVFRDPGGNELAILGRAGRTFQDGSDFLSFANSVATTVEGPLVSVTIPCVPGAFDAVTRGSIVVVRETDTCTFGISTPAEAGAAAMILATETHSGHLSRPMAPEGLLAIPALIASDETATALEAAAGSRVRVRTTGRTWHVPTHNILAELPGSNPDRVLMLGAHLDSAEEGPGMDDDGTGVAAVLEVARALAGSHPVATVRFALWSSEELGLLGARYYLGALSGSESRRIEAYLNADMIGAKNGIRGYYQGTADLPRVAELARQLTRHFTERGLVTELVPITARTDAQAFSDAGFATVGLISFDGGNKSDVQAGLYGGTAGQPEDPCYHKACDDIGNVDMALLEEMTAAYLSAIVDVAFSTQAPAGD